ncbi:MAG: Mov34/MPN/PAD-1 family protein [Methanotrichaceae archaeon]|nr:Mov34/MPN/PAD-1 family protein [Methanotrichaceae archaeon]
MSKRKAKGIARDTLKFILETSRSSMPMEFAGLLQAENEIITDVLILPGTETSRINAMVRLYMMPNMSIVGSAHSHPSSNIKPSQQDLQFFSRTGDYHIIVGPPFDEKSWVCYDVLGARRDLLILDVDFKDDASNDLAHSEDYFPEDEADP